MREHGLRNVRHRRDDELARVGWDELERLLAGHYQRMGYRVEHVGTGGAGTRFDGGIDLKLFRDDQYIVVQCKHWNAKQVPHNAMHELLGIMQTERATGAVLVTSGEFSAAARGKAAGVPNLQLIDGETLRAMLGELPRAGRFEAAGRPLGASVGRAFSAQARQIAGHAGERLLAAAEDRIRHGPSRKGMLVRSAFHLVWLKLVFFMLFVVLMYFVLQGLYSSLATSLLTRPQRAMQAPPVVTQPSVSQRAVRSTDRVPVVDRAPALTLPAGSDADARAAQRRADEAIKVLEATTPEM